MIKFENLWSFLAYQLFESPVSRHNGNTGYFEYMHAYVKYMVLCFCEKYTCYYLPYNMMIDDLLALNKPDIILYLNKEANLLTSADISCATFMVILVVSEKCLTGEGWQSDVVPNNPNQYIQTPIYLEDLLSKWILYDSVMRTGSLTSQNFMLLRLKEMTTLLHKFSSEYNLSHVDFKNDSFFENQ